MSSKPAPKKPSGKVFDVRRPGKALASPTSRPAIIGHKPEVQDSVSGLSGISDRRLLNKPKQSIKVTPSDSAENEHKILPRQEAASDSSVDETPSQEPAKLAPASPDEEALAIAKAALESTETKVPVRTTEKRIEPLTGMGIGSDVTPGAPPVERPEPQAEPGPEPAAEAEPAEPVVLPPERPAEPESPPEPTPEPQSEPITEPEPQPGSVPIVESEPEPQPEAEVAQPAQPAAESEPEPQSEPTPEPEPAAPAEPSAEPQNEPQESESSTPVQSKRASVPDTEVALPSEEVGIPEYDEQRAIVVSHHHRSSSQAWHVVLLVLIIVVLAAAAVDILIDGGILNWTFVPHTNFFKQ